MSPTLLRHKDNTSRVSMNPAMTGRQVIWIAIVIIIIGMTWDDPQPVSSSIRQLSPQSVGLSDVDDESDDNDMPLGAAGSIKIASIQSCVNTIEHLTAARDAALVDLSHGSRAPPRAPAELNRRVVLLSLRTVFDRSEVSSASSFFDESSLDLLCRTWLSCYRFRARQIRLLLSVSAYNLDNLLRRLVLPAAIRSTGPNAEPAPSHATAPYQ
jgi:hypothetical protein